MDEIAGGKIRFVVVDLVVADLRTHENVAPKVITNPRSHVDQKMIGT